MSLWGKIVIGPASWVPGQIVVRFPMIVMAQHDHERRNGSMLNVEVPDPADRSQAWVGVRPAYQAWCESMAAADLEFEERKHVVKSNDLIHHYGENAMDRETLVRIADLGALVELGAGNGYTARLLDDVGADVIATDITPSDHRLGSSTWYPVERGSYESTLCGSRIPLLIWPYIGAPSQWLHSAAAPDRIVVVNDVAPQNLGTRPGGTYHDVLFKGWAVIESFPVQTGWRQSTDYVHVWTR